jgi:long-chain-fatty-acid--CoA ligase ACSBG
MDDKVIEDAISAQTPSDCVSLIYTSGTTGDPKGVMITHDNLSWTTKIIHQMIGDDFTVGNKIVSYLPLSHIAGQLVDIFFSLSIGITIYFAQPDALKGSLGETLREVEPTLFLGVPRVWEKFMEKLSAMLPRPGSGPPPTPEMMQAIKAKVRAGLGLTKCKVMITAAAPTSMEVFNFFAKFGIDICEVWGMSELTGPGTTTTYNTFVPNYWKLGSIGKPYIGTEVKIDNPDPVTGEGEVCARGRHVMMGYLNKPEKTSETIDAEGWLHSGDIGKMDKDGFFYITGRMKEIIITSGGENIAPVPVEDAVKKNAPFLSNVILIGDKRKFISCLVTLKCDMNPLTGGPTDSLTAEAIQLISSLGSGSTKVSEVIDKKDEAVYAAIQKAIDTTNENAASNAQKIQKFTILKDDLSIPGGELGIKYYLLLKSYLTMH